MVSLAVVAASLAVRWLLDDVLDQRLPFLLTIGALLVLVLMVRTGPFLAAVIAGWTGSLFFFVPHKMSFMISGTVEGVAVAYVTAVLATTVVAAWISHRNLAAREREQEAVRESEDRLSAIFANAAVGLSELSPEGRFLRVNDELCRMLDRPREWLLNASVADVTHEEDIAESLNCVQELIATGESASIDKRYVQPDGTVVFANSAVSILNDAQGNPRSVLAVTVDLTQRKLAEDELRYRGEQFETLLNQAPVGVYVVDSDLRIVQANPIALRAGGMTVEAVLGAKLEQVHRTVWSSERVDTLVRDFRRTLETGESYSIAELGEFRVDRNVMEYYQWRIDRITLPDGSHGVVCYFNDISEHVRAKQILSESEERYRTLLESIDEGFCVVEVTFNDDGSVADFCFVETNPAFDKHTGLQEAAGKHVSELVPRVEDHWYRLIESVASTGRSERFMLQAEEMNGRWFAGYVLRLESTEKPRVAALFTDVTKRKQTEDALRESEERLRIAREAAQLGLHDFNIVTGEVDWDHRTRELWGVDDDVPVTYETWLKSIHPDDRDRADRGVKEAIDPSGSRRYADEYRVVNNKDGTTCWVAVTGSVMFDQSQRPVRLVGTVQDITERKMAEDALRDADRRKDEFIATLAHELRNPLAPIRMSVNILRNVRDDSQRFDQIVEVVSRQSAYMARLIDDLLDVSRITRGKISLRKQRIDLIKLVSEFRDSFVDKCRSLGLRLTLQLPSETAEIIGDSVRLSQIINNLFTNACKYTNRGGRIEVEVERQESHAVLRVRDTGMGIAQENLERIFDLFAQVGTPGRTAQGGLGIGLSLTRSLVHLHGGSISAASAGPGKGAEFTVRLPLASPLELPVKNDDQRATATLEAKQGRRVLVVDDNRDVLSAVEMMLTASGHHVQTAENGRTAIDVAEQVKPEVVVLDIGLPDIDGYEVAKTIRQQPWGKHMHLIAMTGWGRSQDKRQALDAGFDMHMTKTEDPETLDQLIRGFDRPIKSNH